MNQLKGLALAFGVLISLNCSSQVVINEFMADNISYSADQNGEYDDWIELYNNGPHSISLKDWFLSDDALNKTKWKFPDTSIAGGAFMVIWADEDVFQSGFHANFKLSKGGEQIFLSRSDSVVTDSIDFAAQLPNTATGRFPSGVGPFAFVTPTIGVTNQPLAPINPVPWHKLVINELMAFNDTVVSDQDSEFDPWLEVYNTSSTDTVSLFGLFLSQDRNIPFGSALKDTVVLPNQRIIVWVDGNNREEGLHSAFPMKQEGGFFGIVNADGSYVDSLSYPAQPANVSFKRIPDVTGIFRRSLPSFNAVNVWKSLPPSPLFRGELVINEFMADNTLGQQDQNGEYEDWVEIYNTSSRAINMRGVYLSDNESNPFKWYFPDTIVPSNSYLIVWLDNDVSQSGLHAPYKLSTLGEELVMCWPTDYLLDSTSFGLQHIDTARARIPNGTGTFYFSLPTHGAYNSQASIILPVDLLEFRVNAIECAAELEWFTANEEGIAEYVIQRSFDGDKYQDIGTLQPQLMPGIHKYSFSDEYATSGYYFYRIKILSLDGSENFSSVLNVSVNCGNQSEHLVFPNPVSDQLYWRSWNIATPKMTVELKDIRGRTVLSKAIVHEDGSLYGMDVSGLKAGTYMLRFVTENYVRTQFIVVQN